MQSSGLLHKVASALAEPPQEDSAKAETTFPKPHLPPQRVDQLIELVQHILHLSLVVTAIGTLAQRADAIAVVARLGQGIRDGVVEVVRCCPLLDVRIERGELATHLGRGVRRVVRGFGGVEGTHDRCRRD